MARLDRIPEVKEVARIAACIGRGFDFSLLACVADHAEPDLLAALDKLARSGLIFCRGPPPNARCTFKHTLVRDAAYQSLLKSRRQQLHARIAEALEQEFPDVGMTEPELLAHHWCEAGNIDKALQYLREASARAVERSANSEAAAHLRAALELVQEQPPSDKRWASEAALWLDLGAALTSPKGYAADEVREAFTLAEKLCRKTGDREQLFLSLRGLWNCHLLRTELREASVLAEQIFELGQQFGTAERMLVAHRVMATSLFHLGRIEDARRLFTAGLAFWDPGHSADYTVAYARIPACSVAFTPGGAMISSVFATRPWSKCAARLIMPADSRTGMVL
jgi:predicted ATPase